MALGSTDVLGLPGVMAGRYRPLGVLGRGAIAEVVRARDEQTGAEVALKILYPHLRDSAIVVERFRREVEIVRRIAHPNVLAIHDVVESDGRLFLVMDFHPGGDLADQLARRGRLPPSEIVRLATQLCGALGAAHRAGVVHRDVKPSNVLCGGGVELDVRLCDFGLARTVEHAGLTVANAVLGTPEYMAPEVVTEGQADPRSDIYSLGVVLFEAATGRLPFFADSPYQLMRQHIDVEAPRARSLVPDLPPALDEAIARALAKEPLDRFATTDDLQRALAEEPRAVVSTSPAPSPTRRRTCPTCGGWLIAEAATCADCGARTLRLEWQQGGVDVLVEGPGKVANKIDAVTHVALYKILDELPEGGGLKGQQRRAPRVPFYVARGIAEESAGALVDRLRAIGLDARIVPSSLLAPKSIRAKSRQVVLRYIVLCGGATGYNLQAIWRPLRHVLGRPIFLILGIAGVLLLPLPVASLFASRRPLLRGIPGPSQDSLGAELSRALRVLVGRQDRRLVGRVLERVRALETLGRRDVAEPLARRAVLATGGLTAIDERRSVDPAVNQEAGPALEELRREEQSRVFFRSDLLRTASRLDSANLIVARAAALQASGEASALDEQIRELTTELEAEEDLREWLRPLK